MNPIRYAAAVVLLLAVGAALTGCRDLGPGGEHGNKTSTVVYRVTGHGTADVAYAATAASTMTRKTGVSLPWSTTVTTTDHSGTVYRVSVRGGRDTDCAIEVNGVRVNVDRITKGTTLGCSFVK